MVEIGALGGLRGKEGREIAVSDWLTVTQERINAFAESTGDDQWIHVDEARAAQSPFHGTIAHGFLTLALVSALLRQAIRLPPLRMAINYGLNRVRFISPVAAGSRVRARIAPAAVETESSHVQITWAITIELEGKDKPAASVEWIVRYYPAALDVTGNGGSRGNGD